MKKDSKAALNGYIAEPAAPLHKKAARIAGVVIVLLAAAVAGFVISMQRDPQRGIISDAVQENSELKLRVAELEKENKELGKIVRELQENAARIQNDEDRDEAESGSEDKEDDETDD